MMSEEMMSEEMNDGGGCLIATAAFGSEMAPQVQSLREVRDNIILETESGKTFMTSFNHVYYAFSPAMADLERKDPMVRDTVRAEMIASLTIFENMKSIPNVMDLSNQQISADKNNRV